MRGVESAALPTAQRYGMGLLTFGPSSSGRLSGRSDPATGRRGSGAGRPFFGLAVPGNQADLLADTNGAA